MINWEEKTLGELTSNGNGLIQTGPFGSQLHASDYVDAGIPCIMPVNLKNNKIDISKVSFISELDANRLSKHIVKEKDIIYSRRGDVTQKALITSKEDGYFCGTGCLLVRVGNSINPSFLTYFLSTPRSKTWIKNHAVGITMPNLNTKILGKFPVSFPSLNTQKSIAKILSDLDAKIELNNKINAELESMAKLIYDYWFVQFEFPNKDGQPYKSSGGKMVYNQELKREIPEGWEVKSLGEYAYIKKGKLITEKTADTNGKVKVVSAGLNFSYFHSESNYESNTITISASGASAGFINFWREPIFACDCTTVRGNCVADTLQLLGFLQMRQEYIYQQARGSAQPHVYPKDIEELKITIPPSEVIKQYGLLVVSGNTNISNNLQQNQKLTELRDWLLPMLMNGQVRVGETPRKENYTTQSDLNAPILGMVAEDRGEYKTK